MSAQESLPSIQGPPVYDEFEAAVVRRLKGHLEKPASEPLLVIGERDNLIESKQLYFAAIDRRYTPRNALQQVREGTLTDADIAQKQRAARAIVRGRKTDMYVDRLMTATFAVDTCRALCWVATKGELVPVLPDDTPDTLKHRTSDYVDDLLQAGRETRLLSGASMERTTQKLANRFDTDPAAMVDLAKLAGVNSLKKVYLYLDELYEVSREFERISKEEKERLAAYIAGRPAEFHDKPELNQLIADKARKKS